VSVSCEGGEIADETQQCTEALFTNSTVYPSLFVGK